MLTSQTKVRSTRVAKNAAMVPRMTPASASPTLPEDGPEDPLARRPEGHADGELAGALFDPVCDEPVNAGCGQQQTDDLRTRRDRHLETFGRHRLLPGLVHRPERGERLTGIDGAICSWISRISAAAGRSARTTQLTWK